MTYSSAGHEPPIVACANGDCKELEIGGLPLGLTPGITYEQSRHRLDPGDIVVAVTDGITEARAPGCVLYGKERLLEVCEAASKSFSGRDRNGIAGRGDQARRRAVAGRCCRGGVFARGKKCGRVNTMIEEARISMTEDAGGVTITGGGSLTFYNATEFGERLKEASLAAERVTVDLRPAEFIDTQIVQDLGRAGVTLLKRDKRLKVVVSETAYPLRVIEISGYEQIMDVRSSERT